MCNIVVIMLALVGVMMSSACLDGGSKWPPERNSVSPTVDAGADASEAADTGVATDASYPFDPPDIDPGSLFRDSGVPDSGDGDGMPVVLEPTPDLICECVCYRQ